MAGKISRDTPLAEITLRKYESPSGSDRELVRRLCLAVGLLQPGDSRDVVVDVLYVLLMQRRDMTSIEIERAVIDVREEQGLQILGVAPSNIRRQLLRLRDIFFVEKVTNSYRINENESLTNLFSEKLESFLLAGIVKRVKEYIKAVDKEFPLKKE